MPSWGPGSDCWSLGSRSHQPLHPLSRFSWDFDVSNLARRLQSDAHVRRREDAETNQKQPIER